MSVEHSTSDDFGNSPAARWLQMWSGLGGSVHLLPDGSALIGYPEYGASLAFREDQEQSGEAASDDEYLERSVRYSSRMGAILDDLSSKPGAADDVKAHLRSLGLWFYPGRPAW